MLRDPIREQVLEEHGQGQDQRERAQQRQQAQRQEQREVELLLDQRVARHPRRRDQLDRHADRIAQHVQGRGPERVAPAAVDARVLGLPVAERRPQHAPGEEGRGGRHRGQGQRRPQAPGPPRQQGVERHHEHHHRHVLAAQERQPRPEECPPQPAAAQEVERGDERGGGQQLRVELEQVGVAQGGLQQVDRGQRQGEPGVPQLAAGERVDGQRPQRLGGRLQHQQRHRVPDERVERGDQEQDERGVVPRPRHAADRGEEPAVQQPVHRLGEERQVEVGVEVVAVGDDVERRVDDGVRYHQRREDERGTGRPPPADHGHGWRGGRRHGP